MAAEEVVLVAGGALGALHAADKEHRNAHCNQDGDGVFDGREPVNQAFHNQRPYSKGIQRSGAD